MSQTDPQIRALFRHVREAVDVLEQILLRDSPPRANENPRVTQDDRRTAPSPPGKLAYTLKEVHNHVGISRSAIYLALGAGELRAVKRGRTTLVLAKDLEAWLEKLPASSGRR
jgi:excisionase family DNA binding protein